MQPDGAITHDSKVTVSGYRPGESINPQETLQSSWGTDLSRLMYEHFDNHHGLGSHLWVAGT